MQLFETIRNDVEMMLKRKNRSYKMKYDGAKMSLTRGSWIAWRFYTVPASMTRFGEISLLYQ